MSMSVSFKKATNKTNNKHNNRDFTEKQKAQNSHIDFSKSDENKILVQKDLRELYEREFSEPLKNYNDKQKRNDRKIDDYYQNVAGNTGEFYKGTLRSGQVLKCDTSIVIIGDVNPGARIVARGNIVILGSLKGNAYAGAAGDESCFVTALDMDPVQVKIGNVIGRSADRGPWEAIRNRKRALDPQIALVSDGNIMIEPITKGLLNKI